MTDICPFCKTWHEWNEWNEPRDLDCYEREITILIAKNAKLQGVVDKLPKTKDGVVFDLHTEVWGFVGCDKILMKSKLEFRTCDWDMRDKYEWYVIFPFMYGSAIKVSECYSTRQAAEQAKERDDDE